ncbi:MAG: SPFH domain-containing protein [Candidatus Micrarchaeota archaeon]|nr:SPFH domain-containing protein [Candidatus Micrarchaeota archaeon]
MVIAIINQYEKGIRYFLGRYETVLEPGLCLNIPFIHKIDRLDMRTITIKIPRLECLTKDNVSIKITAAVYYKIVDIQKAVLEVANVDYTVMQYAQTAMRDAVGKWELDKLLSERDTIGKTIEKIVDTETANWGVDIQSIKIQDIEIPEDMKRSMAREAEGERIRRSLLILAEGELEAAKNYANAAKTLKTSSGAMHLKTLQALTTSISMEDAPTHIYLVPKNLLRALGALGSTSLKIKK